MRQEFNFFIILSYLFITGLQGQPTPEKSEFEAPVRIPMYLSGNFAELRVSHFHAGIDIKTGGVEGKNVYAAADGYISRIKIQTGGYGRTLYLAHPNGYTTVYAHLKEFDPSVEKYVKNYQYRNNTHTLDLYPEPGEITVSKGEKIALSGNSGSSSGPHLHFEIRDSKNQHPLNVLLFGFDIKDNIKPDIEHVAIYPLNSESAVNGRSSVMVYNVKGTNGIYSINYNSPIEIWGEIGFGIETYDYLNYASNRCGIYSIQLLVDGKEKYFQSMDEFSFAKTRYIKAHVDYNLYTNRKLKIQRSNILPHNQLDFYKSVENRGIITFTNEGTKNIKYVVRDTYGNESTLQFQVKVRQPANIKTTPLPAHFIKKMSYNSENSFITGDIKLQFPGHAFYNDVLFTYQKYPSNHDGFSEIHEIHDEAEPLHKHFSISIKASNVPYELEEKTLIAGIDDRGRTYSTGGKWNNGYVTSRVRNFGKYYVTMDTIAPVITPINISDNANLENEEQINFSVMDDLSGIKSYNGYIDNKWSLFEYDPKNNLVYYQIDPSRLNKGKTHELELYVIDKKDNIAVFHARFFW